MIAGATLRLHAGPAVPEPLPLPVLEAVEQVTVTNQDGARSGFQIVLAAARDRGRGRDDVAVLHERTFRIGNRVQISAALAGREHVLVDGVVTSLALAPSADPGASRLTITGEDLLVLLDLVEVSLPFPCMTDALIATTMLATLAGHGVVPVVVPEPSALAPPPTEGPPHHTGTALGILNEMAQKWGYTCFLEPGPVRGASVAYWGPPRREGVPQKALTWRMGASGDLGSISFRSDGLKPQQVYGLVKDGTTGVTVPVAGLPYSHPPLAARPSFVENLPLLGVKRLADDDGGNVLAGLWRATGEVFRSSRAAVTAAGELDVAVHGDVLRARGLVEVRGVGESMDGLWYVASVTDTVARGRWKQAFTLEREGVGALARTVRSA